MKSFAVLKRAKEEEIKDKYPVLGGIYFINKLIQPFIDEIEVNNIKGAQIKISKGFENFKLNRAYKIALNKYGYVLSKDYDINFNLFFYHSCLIRALDYYTISLGCDIRLSEVVIADASTLEGKNFFFLLLPFARRIILVTEKKEEVINYIEYAALNYGTSVAVIEDPVKAAERADVIILSSDKAQHNYLADITKPMLLYRFIYSPKTPFWFNDVDIAFKDVKFDIDFVQGYVEIKNKEAKWNSAEKEGFYIKSIKQGEKILIER